jgi:anaerobic magnesium-protoporphyrin IX monomethyl ester cyclase
MPSSPTKPVTVLLIQPPVMRPILRELPEIMRYFSALDKEGVFLGDSPREPNLGLLSIGAMLRNSFPREDIETALRAYEPSIIGVSYMTSSYGLWGKRLVQLCNRVHPEAHIILGGIHPTVRYREICAECEDLVDAIVVGEGEYVFTQIVESLLTRRTRLQDIPHVYTPETRSRVVERAQLSNKELAALPPPAYDLLQRDSFPVVVRFYTERGCPKECSFCSVGEFFKGRLTSAVPVETSKAVDLVSDVLNKYDVDHFVIGDLSMFNQTLQDREFVKQLAKSCEASGFVANWWCQTRGDLINEETVQILKDTGCRQVALGCEAGTDVQLQRVLKGESCSRIKKSLELLRKSGIETQCYWIIGLPGDDVKAVKETQKPILEYLRAGLTTLTHITVLVPYPNTPVASKPQRHGIKVLHEDWARYWMNCDPFGCDIPAYETVDARGARLLSEKDINTAWLETISMVADYYESVSRQTI